MVAYVILKRASQPWSLKDLFTDGADPGIQERALAELGGKVLFQAAVAGAYDFVLIAELPDDAAVATVEFVCNGRGFETTALRAYSPSEAGERIGTESGERGSRQKSTGLLTHVFLKRALGKGSLEGLLADGANPGVQEQAIASLGGQVIF